MTTTTATTTPTVTASRRRALRAWLLWTAGFLAFPVAGIAGTAVAGRVDSPAAALLGGLAAGAVLGLGQALLSSGRLPMLRWTAATALGMSAGLLLGAQAVGYGTTLAQIAVVGALTGAVLGAAQALALPPGQVRAGSGPPPCQSCGQPAGPSPPRSASPSKNSSPCSARAAP